MRAARQPPRPAMDDGDFLEEASRLALEGPDRASWRQRLGEYAAYKDFFGSAFVEAKEIRGAFRFRATYLGPWKVGPLWRELEVLGSQTLEALAEGIVRSMGWDNGHLHAFRLARHGARARGLRRGFEITTDTGGESDARHPQYMTNGVLVSHVDHWRYPLMHFEFDFGDGHEFAVAFMGIRPLAKGERASGYPRLVDQRGVAPEQYPDPVGGAE